jgi:hypothetical protein
MWRRPEIPQSSSTTPHGFPRIIDASAARSGAALPPR